MSNSLFESFNARSLEPMQVGKGYIYSATFRDVLERSNTAIIGPRGSGKTTLLKMLTLPALASWRDPRAKEITAGVDYIAIYVPADFTWHPDFRRPIRSAPDKAVDDLLSYSLFRSHVLLAACETLEYMAEVKIQPRTWLHKFGLSSDEMTLERITQALARQWDLDLRTGGLQGIKEAIASQIKRVQFLVTMTSLREFDPIELLNSNQFLATNFLDDLKVFADAIEAFGGIKVRWAACFDEVEIAPDRVKEQIWRSSRSFDQRFLVKFSASPCDDGLDNIFGPKMPMEGHDYRPVYLSEQRAVEVRRFSQQIFSAICSDLNLSPERAETVLGSSFFEDERSPGSSSPVELSKDHLEGRVSPYAKQGAHYRRFLSLSKKDDDFRRHLEERGIDLSSLEALPERTKAAEIRKLISTVAVRDEFFFERRGAVVNRKERRRRYRAKKNVPTLYTGAGALFMMCEGNPRWLIGLLRPLLQSQSSDSSSRTLTVARTEQARRLEKVITSYLALLSTVQASEKSGVSLSIVDVIDEIGDFFSEQVVGERFRPEPVLSFVVDRAADPKVKSAIGRGVNQGAFVLLPEKDKPVQAGKIEGRRLRMAHLLAPLYRLPLVLGRKIDLSSILAGEEGPALENSLLLDLFKDFAND